MNKILGEYIVTGKDFPSWLKDEFRSGRGKVKSDDGDFENITMFTPSGTVVAHKGDKILKLKSGVVVVPAAMASKYMRRASDE